ncbi:MAG TPA: hypothetical protein VEF04_19385 [Blastocatellia bacterium]|nr:hypothetical protein [Blastocatellia bacterium]
MIAIYSVLLLTSCSRHQNQEVATYDQPKENFSLTILRELIEPDSKQYKRTLVLRVNQKEVLRHNLKPDTGGCSRANLLLASFTVLLLEDAYEIYEIDIEKKSISTDLSKSNKQEEVHFLGSFDIDEKNAWRFIPNVERQYLFPNGKCK